MDARRMVAVLAFVAPALAACGSNGDRSGTNADGGAGASGTGGVGDGGVMPSDAGAASGDGSARTESGTGSDASLPDASPGSDASAASDGATGAPCGAGDPNLPPEPTIPPACSSLPATRAVAPGAVPSESPLDTASIQAALGACPSGHALRLVSSGANDAFLTGPLTIPAGVTLWIDAGVTLYGTRDPAVYGSAAALITVSGAGSGIVGDGVIDGQGGEPKVGSSQSWWDANGAGGSSPALIKVSGATSFTLYRITLHDAPMFHVKLGADGFVVWGITIKTPSKTVNSVGTALTPSVAHNTDGVDPGEAASHGTIACSRISDGDDQIAIKGGTSVSHLTIAHDHFGAGHGMSIGSETNGGVSDVNVYDLSIDGTGSGMSGGSSNGIRIKSDASRGGLVTNVTYSDVCVRGLANPILLTPRYSTATGSLIPTFQGITIRDFRSVASAVTPTVTLDGYDAAHATAVTLDNVIVDGIAASDVKATFASVSLGPGDVNFKPSGTGVTVNSGITGTSQPNQCTGKWVTF